MARARVFYNEAITSYPESPVAARAKAEAGRGRGKSHPARAGAETSEEEETFLLLLSMFSGSNLRAPDILSGGSSTAPRNVKSDLRSSRRSPPLRGGMRFQLSVVCLVTAIIGLCGCSQYQLGTAAKVSFATLYVEPVESETLLPQAREIVGIQLREAFARDGRVSLVNSAEAADAILRVTLRDYRRDVASVTENDTGLARKYILTLDVAVRLVRKTATIFLRTELFGCSGMLLPMEDSSNPNISGPTARGGSLEKGCALSARRLVTMHRPILAPSLLAGDHATWPRAPVRSRI
jgi:outer membrane lipopolysaccharide assembly protein LptE/RlpB